MNERVKRRQTKFSASDKCKEVWSLESFYLAHSHCDPRCHCHHYLRSMLG